jgi:hypothetical protein
LLPLVKWSLHKRRPRIEISLVKTKARRRRRLVADTGGGSDQAPFELLLLERDRRKSGGVVEGQVSLSGAFTGWFNVYSVKIRIPRLSFREDVRIVGVPKVPEGFDGIACFKFLNRFHYGNSGDCDHFGLET